MSGIALERVGPYLWRIPPDARPGMRVPGLVVADDALIGHLRSDASLEQLANAATLPGIVKAALAMPDIHQGYGLPVGGVVATDARDGVVSPGAIGFDINCGVRLLRTSLRAADLAPRLTALVERFYDEVPTGVGARSALPLDARDLPAVLTGGAAWAVGRERGWTEDLQHIESEGQMPGAVADSVSSQAIERGRRQLGTLGAGNHFLEVQAVEEVYDAAQAAAWGVETGAVTVMIHTGSRGLGHQVCTDFLRVTGGVLARYGITLPDRQLACAPLGSPEARAYLGAMRAAANFAFANRQLIAHAARTAFAHVLGVSARDLGMTVVYDVAHNIAKEEEHEERAPPSPPRPPQGRHPRLSRAAGHRPRRHGALLLPARRHGRRHAGDVRHHLPRRRADDEPHGRGEGRPRPEHRQGAGRAWRGGARHRARRARRGDARGLQGRARGRRRRPRARDLATGRAAAPARRDQGLTVPGGSGRPC
jgi:RNA-splicing ligase RtcB